MTNTPTENAQTTIGQIRQLESAGCQIIRVAVPTMRAARALTEICRASHVPIVADIHFNHQLALVSLEAGIAGLRLNPGTLTKQSQVGEVARAAGLRRVPIRIGVNGGSLEADIERKYGGPTAEALVASASRHVSLLEREGFHDILISLKSSSVPTTIAAYRLMANQCAYPLHVGVTEAGAGDEGLTKSYVGIGVLLLEGIGETVRISLTGDPVQEVVAARKLLGAMGTLVSAPSGGLS